MRIRHGLALLVTSSAMVLPASGFAWTDPARGFDNPAPEAAAPELPSEPARIAPTVPRPEVARYFPPRTEQAMPQTFVSVPPPAPVHVVPLEVTRRSAASAMPPRSPESELREAAYLLSTVSVDVRQHDMAMASSGVSWAEVSRAVSTNSTLDTPYTAQVDALESSRRAQRASRSHATGRPLFALQVPPHAATTGADENWRTAYLLWAGTFFALAAMLSYVGWRVLRLVFGR